MGFWNRVGAKGEEGQGTPNCRLREATLCSVSHVHYSMVHGERWESWDMAGRDGLGDLQPFLGTPVH